MLAAPKPEKGPEEEPENLSAAFSQGLDWYRQGRLAQARAVFSSVLQQDPTHIGAMHLLGLISARSGETAAGQKLLEQALLLAPGAHQICHDLARLYQLQSRPEAAIELYLKVLAEHPDASEVHLNLGNLYMAQQAYAQAQEHYQTARAAQPDSPEIHFNLGQLYRALGQHEAARQAFGQVVQLAPDFALAWQSLGQTELSRQAPDQAETHFLQALKLNPGLSDACLDLAGIYQQQGRYREALSYYQQVAQLLPDQAEAFNLVGGMLYLLGETDQALAAYQRALQLDPRHASAWNNLASTLLRQRRYPEALQASHRSLELNPDSPQAWQTLATVYEDIHLPAQARQACLRAQALAPKPGLTVRLALMLPGLYHSSAEILAVRQRYEANLDQLLSLPLRLTDPHAEVGYMPFYLNYHHLPVCRLNQKLARFYLQACPELAWTAPHCLNSRKHAGRIKIGFVSHFFCNHSVGKLFRGLIAQLDRAFFEVTVFAFAEPGDEIARDIHHSADQSVILTPELDPARQQIAATTQDLLFYTDIGMSALTYFLAFARLAPLQCVTWGYGTSTGIPNLDAFISSTGMESASSRQDYSEQLLLMQHLLPYYQRPKIPPEVRSKSRADYGLPEHQHLYICPQSGFKLHPDFDQALAGILRRDPQAQILLLKGYHPAMEHFLQARFGQQMPDVASRIHFLPRQSAADFLQLIALSDVMLDAFPSGGGITTYDALSTGTPLVTLEGQQPGSRLTPACFRQIDYLETITWTVADYIEKAVRLGCDPAYRAQVSAGILEKVSGLYLNAQAVREFETLLRTWHAEKITQS